MLKKINAILVIPTMLLFVIHSLFMGLTMMGIIGFVEIPYGKILLWLMCAHVFIAILIMFFQGGEGIVKYAKQNKKTIVQRATAILIMIVIHFHFKDYVYFESGVMMFADKDLLHFIPEMLIAVTASFHTCISAENALITIGINNKIISKVIRLVFYVVFVYIIVAIIYYFFIG